ncbi:MAG TPA: tRNA (adenosine(37)-N6)-dimethylallyltransferase MiaA [Bacteroidia bacterium]|nr:tRNA (adenosine(37)-N6)-dimethylallyltransferase MiaA [Bacteroidia bacterium]
MSEKKLIAIIGPTAVGKTALSIKLAEILKTEIVSADSRQFYKEMEIGTAKPSAEELQKVKHHFINSLSIQDDYSVGDYEKDALKYLDELFKKHDTVILVGGSGLFVNAVCEGLDILPSGDKGIREHYEKLFSEKGLEPLQNELKEKDPAYFETVDIQNPRRLIRALEVISLVGKPYSDFRKKTPTKRDFTIVKIGLNLDKEILRKRIDQRVDDMLASSWLEECKKLYTFRNLNALKTVGYSELFDFIEGKTDWTTTITNIKTNTWHYAKRQLTWFKKDKEINWFSPLEEDDILNFLGLS